MTILIADPNPYQARFIALALSDYPITIVESSTRLLCVLATETPELVLVHADMAAEHGTVATLCRHSRYIADVPLLFYAESASFEERTEALMAGADDFLAWPLPAAELRARIVAVLRRRHGPPHLQLQVGGMCLNLLTHTVTTPDGRTVRLSSTEVNVLYGLMSSAGQVLSDQALQAMWRSGRLPSARAVTALIQQLREKIEADPACPRWLQTVPRGGYMLAV